jgi:hypothetical protein
METALIDLDDSYVSLLLNDSNGLDCFVPGNDDIDRLLRRERLLPANDGNGLCRIIHFIPYQVNKNACVLRNIYILYRSIEIISLKGNIIRRKL